MLANPSKLKTGLVVTQYYWPEMVGSGPYCSDLAEHLARQQWRVQVFTCRPHYPAGAVHANYRDGAGDREHRNGVTIRRVPPWRPDKRGAASRIASEAVFLARGLWALATGTVRRADLVVSLCPSILTVLLGCLAVRRRGRHVALVHDIQSGLAEALNMAGGRAVLAVMRRVERMVLNRTDMVLVLSDEMRIQLQRQGVTAPIDVLPLWVDARRIAPGEAEPGSAQPPTVLYSGNFGRKQALQQVVDMAAILQQRTGDIRIILRGEGSEKQALIDQAEAHGLRNVRFAPLVPAEHLAAALAEADIHLVPQDANTADFAVPSKAYAILAAGRPFVAAAREGSQLWRLMEESGALICVPAGDAGALADAVERLARDPELRRRLGEQGRRFVVANHSKDIVLARFADIAGGQPEPEQCAPQPAVTS